DELLVIAHTEHELLHRRLTVVAGSLEDVPVVDRRKPAREVVDRVVQTDDQGVVVHLADGTLLLLADRRIGSDEVRTCLHPAILCSCRPTPPFGRRYSGHDI